MKSKPGWAGWKALIKAAAAGGKYQLGKLTLAWAVA